MKAALRLGSAWLAAAIALAPASALAQAIPQSTTNTPAADAVGPKELQNFSLNGTVTQRSDRPVTTAPTPARTQAPATDTAASTTAQAPARAPAASKEAPAVKRAATVVASERPSAPSPERQVATATPPPVASAPTTQSSEATALPTTPAPTPSFTPDTSAPAPTLAPEHSMSLVPWLLALVALLAGGGFLFWRSRPRQAFAGGPQVDAFVAPEARPAPVPPPAAPAPPKPAGPIHSGIVTTRLRPWVEIAFQPVRCTVTNDKAEIEFEIELFNSGSAPARGVLVEASLFNAGPTQERDISAFFSKPVGDGERIPVIPPLKRVPIRTHISVPRDQVHAYELAGRTVFVPVIAFNALYSWSSGEGQTSVSYLLGANTKTDKLAPFRLDLGPRLFRALGARLLDEGVRK